MKKYLTISILAAISLSAAASQLPFSDTFDTLNPGSIDSQNGWTNLSGTAIVQSGVVACGSQAMEIQDNGTVTHSLSSTGTSAQISFKARITAAPTLVPSVTNDNTGIAFFVNTNLHLVVYSNTTPVELAVQMPANVWTRFDISWSYSSLKWQLNVNGTNVAQNLGLYSAGQQIDSLLIANTSTDPAYFDELNAENTDDTYGDGLPDWWEQLYYGGITNALPNGIAQNGLTCLQDYVAGLNPNDANALLKITQSARNSLAWASQPGSQYDIYWTSNLLAGFTYLYTPAGDTFVDTGHAQDPACFYQIRAHK